MTASFSVVPNCDLREAKRLDADRYKPEYLELENHLRNMKNVKSISQLILKPVSTGYTPRERELTDDSKKVHFIKTNTLREGIITVENTDFLPVESIRKTDYLNTNDVVVTIIGATFEIIGRAAIFLDNYPPSVVNQNIAIIRLDKEKVNPFYIAMFLNSKYGREQLWMLSRQTEQVNLNCREVEKVLVPLLSTSLQEKIETLYKKALDTISTSKKLYLQAEKLLLKTLNLTELDQTSTKTFSGNASEVAKAKRLDAEFYQPKYSIVLKKIEDVARENDWKIFKIVELSKPLKYGTSEKLAYLNEGVPFLRITDIQNLDFDPDAVCHIAEQDARNLKNATVKEGDLVISRSGTLGLTVSIGKEFENAIFGSYFIRIRPKIKINSTYLAFYLNSILGKIQVEKFSTGTIQTNLTKPSIENIRVIIPKEQFQDKILNLLNASKIAIQEGRKLLKQAIAEIEKEIEDLEALRGNVPMVNSLSKPTNVTKS